MNFFKKSKTKTDKKTQKRSVIEIVKENHLITTKRNQIRNLIENSSKVGGYVTITVNKGRKDERVIQQDKLNLLTTSGRDFFHAQVYTNTSAGTKGGNGIAVSADATDPVAGDTTLVGEITSGGLERVQADTISHTASTNVTTIENTYTATATHTDVHKSGLFNQDTLGGQMTHASEFTADVTLQTGDTLTVTWTLTLG